jgi:hypothetical protein
VWTSIDAVVTKQRVRDGIKARIRDVMPKFVAVHEGALLDAGKRVIQEIDFFQSSATD